MFTMRFWHGYVALGFGLVLGLGCGNDKKPAAAEKVIARSSEIAEEETDLIERRDLLLGNRRALKSARAELDDKLRVVRASGGSTDELDKQVVALAAKEEGLDDEESQLNSKLDELLAQRRAFTTALASAGGGQAVEMTAREAGLAEREKGLATREARVAQREAAMAEREREVARYKAEKCGVAQPTTIIQTVDVKGSKYTKKDVEPLLSRARKQMSAKGILLADLSGPTQGLEREATKAMGEGDYGRARFAAAQLVNAVNAVKINRAFITAKIDWLSARMKGKTLSTSTQKEVDKLFRDAVTAYGNDKFTSANKSLNRIYSKIR